MTRVALLLLASLVAGCASQGMKPARGAQTIPSCDDVQATTIHRLDGSKISSDALTERIEALRKQAEVHGLAISIFNDRQLVYCKAFGVKRTDTQEPLRTDTVIYGASLSKAVSGVLFMRLVEEGILDLDTPLVSYLDKPVHEYEPKGGIVNCCV